MKKILVLCFCLGGCVNTAPVVNTTVSSQQALIAANAFDVAESAATVYISLPLCGGTAKVCRRADVTKKVVGYVRAGRVLRDQIEGLLQKSGGAAIPVVSYNTLVAVNASLQALYNQYNTQR